MPLFRRLAVYAAGIFLLLCCCLPVFGSSAVPAESAPAEVSSALQISSGEREFINTEPLPALPQEKSPILRPSGIVAWAVIAACALGIILFVHNARMQDRGTFSSRTAARSRWHRTRPARSEMSRRYYHDKTHFRK